MIAFCEWHGMCQASAGLCPLYTAAEICISLPFTCNEGGRQRL